MSWKKLLIGLLIPTALAAGLTTIDTSFELEHDTVIAGDYEIKKGKYKMNKKTLKVTGNLTIRKGVDMTADGTIVMANPDKVQRLNVEKKGVFNKYTPRIGNLVIGESPGVTILDSDVFATSVIINSGAILITNNHLLDVGTGSLIVNGLLDAKDSEVVSGHTYINGEMKPGKHLTLEGERGRIEEEIIPAVYSRTVTGAVVSCPNCEPYAIYTETGASIMTGTLITEVQTGTKTILHHVVDIYVAKKLRTWIQMVFTGSLLECDGCEHVPIFTGATLTETGTWIGTGTLVPTERSEWFSPPIGSYETR